MSSTNTKGLSKHERKLVHTMQLLGDETRFKLFKLLSSKEELCVSELAERLGITTSAVSQHFKTFELLGLVGKKRHGQRICYSLNDSDETVKQIINFSLNL